MLHARAITPATLALGLLAGCVSTTELQQAALPETLNVVDVVVGTERFAGVTGRQIARSSTGVAGDVGDALRSAFAGASDPSGTPAIVSVDLIEVALANAASRVVAQASSVRAVVQVTTQTGETLVPGQVVTGTSAGLRLPGAIGAATTPRVDQDYSDTIRGFAGVVRNLIFTDQQKRTLEGA